MVDPKTNQRRGKGEGRIPNPRSKSLFEEEKNRPKSEEGKGDNLGELESNKKTRIGFNRTPTLGPLFG